MITEQDFVIIPYSKEREISAEYFALQNVLRTFPYMTVKEISEEHIELAKIELLSEFAFMEHILALLDSHLNPGVRWDVSKIELAARYALLIGIYDTKTEQTICERTIELKPLKNQNPEDGGSGNRRLELSTLEYPKPDIYVPSFVTSGGEIVLTGYFKSKDIPQVTIPSGKAYVPFGALSPISSLPAEFGLKQ